jgi:hypothetical protein
VAKNPLQTYKGAINYATVDYKSLGPFSVVCIPWGALHFPDERVANTIWRLLLTMRITI